MRFMFTLKLWLQRFCQAVKACENYGIGEERRTQHLQNASPGRRFDREMWRDQKRYNRGWRGWSRRILPRSQVRKVMSLHFAAFEIG